MLGADGPLEEAFWLFCKLQAGGFSPLARTHDGSGAAAWPPVEINSSGHLVFGGWDVLDLAARFGTPLYVYDESRIRASCREFREAVEGAGGVVAYAGKAFLTQAMVRIVDEEGLWLDVVSGGEIHTALGAGFPAERVLFHGNNKAESELAHALDAGIGRIVVDNFHELKLVDRLARERGRRQPVLLRVTPGIEAHTHEYIATGQQDSKFGFDVQSGQALEAARQAVAAPGLAWRGLHCHVGSQIFEVEPYRLAAEALVNLGAEIRQATGAALLEADIGGGFGIRYLEEDCPPRVLDAVGVAIEALRTTARRHGMEPPRLMIEPGRAIVGEAGITLYTVGSIKEIPGVRTYVAVDGGMADNPRPALYGARYAAVVANRAGEAPLATVRLVGRYCESGDVLIKEAPLQRVGPGDVVALFSTGAYHYSMASNYNRFPRPAAVLVAGGEADLMIERESYADLARLDRIPARLRPKVQVTGGWREP